MRATGGGIVRGPRARFDTLPQETVRDSRLSFRARGILARLLSNEEGFSMTAVDLAREGKEGRAAILAALKELREAGYARTERLQVEKGRWTTRTTIFETPEPKFENRTPAIRTPVSRTIKVKPKEITNPTPTPPVEGGGVGGDEVDWPPQLDVEDREQIIFKAAAVKDPKSSIQTVLDELRVLMGGGAAIKNPTAWVMAGLRKGVDLTPQGRAFARARNNKRAIPSTCHPPTKKQTHRVTPRVAQEAIEQIKQILTLSKRKEK